MLVLHQTDAFASEDLPGLEEAETEAAGSHVEPTSLRLWKTVRPDTECIVERTRLAEDAPHFRTANGVGENGLPKSLNLTMAKSSLGSSFAMHNRVGSINRTITRVGVWCFGKFRIFAVVFIIHCGIRMPPAEGV